MLSYSVGTYERPLNRPMLSSGPDFKDACMHERVQNLEYVDSKPE
jgi:hypothetical protein